MIQVNFRRNPRFLHNRHVRRNRQIIQKISSMQNFLAKIDNFSPKFANFRKNLQMFAKNCKFSQKSANFRKKNLQIFARHTYIRTHIHTYIHACMHACMHACIHTYIRTYINAYLLAETSYPSGYTSSTYHVACRQYFRTSVLCCTEAGSCSYMLAWLNKKSRALHLAVILTRSCMD